MPFNLEESVMRAGYKSCFGCIHYPTRDACSSCSITQPLWEPNERYKRAQRPTEDVKR